MSPGTAHRLVFVVAAVLCCVQSADIPRSSSLREGPGPPRAVLHVHADARTHRVNRHFMGCHSDSGFAHQPRGLYSQMVYGASFEEPWNAAASTGTVAHVGLDNATLFNGKPSMKIEVRVPCVPPFNLQAPPAATDGRFCGSGCDTVVHALHCC